jgi:hypothetical protein
MQTTCRTLYLYILIFIYRYLYAAQRATLQFQSSGKRDNHGRLLFLSFSSGSFSGFLGELSMIFVCSNVKHAPVTQMRFLIVSFIFRVAVTLEQLMSSTPCNRELLKSGAASRTTRSRIYPIRVQEVKVPVSGSIIRETHLLVLQATLPPPAFTVISCKMRPCTTPTMLSGCR